jgi:hypothetical protein
LFALGVYNKELADPIIKTGAASTTPEQCDMIGQLLLAVPCRMNSILGGRAQE